MWIFMLETVLLVLRSHPWSGFGDVIWLISFAKLYDFLFKRRMQKFR